MSIHFHSTRGIFESIGAGAFTDPIFRRHGVEDLTAINAVDPSGRGCIVAVVDQRRTYSPRATRVWRRISAHISAGNRLRQTVAQLGAEADPVGSCEAILTSSGKVEHACGSAEPPRAREALRDALVRIDDARSKRGDPERSVELWRGLVAGRWSLVENFERDGRRYFLAHKNDPVVTSDHALSQREKQILRYAELGHSNKLIAYELGLSTSTVSTTLTTARRKLRTLG